jgi:hypothetical protein
MKSNPLKPNFGGKRYVKIFFFQGGEGVKVKP